MIAYVKGTLEDMSVDSVTIENNGIGYEILCSSYVIRRLPGLHQEVKLVTYLDVKEDSMKLYGFLTSQEKTLFKQLLQVSGIGPKGAMSILNELGPDNLVAAILASDSKAISKANGIGSKTAQKVVLELKDKVSLEGSVFDQGGYNVDMDSTDEATNDISIAAQALVALGYSNTDALKAVKKVEGADGMKTEDIIKAALKHL